MKELFLLIHDIDIILIGFVCPDIVGMPFTQSYKIEIKGENKSHIQPAGFVDFLKLFGDDVNQVDNFSREDSNER
jgi:hypothetical protein